MGDYYNATRGPLSATLTDGSALSLSPKKWVYIPAENEGSASILKLCEKGFLVRAKVPMTQPIVDVVVPAPTLAPSAPTPKPSEKEVVLPPSEVAASTSSMKEEFSRKKK